MIARRFMLTALMPLAACSGITAGDAARLANDGEAAASHVLTDLTAARRRVDAARDLALLRANIAAAFARTAQHAEAVEPDRRLVVVAEILAQASQAIESLREAYRSFGAVTARRNTQGFETVFDRAAEDATALRTVLDRYAAADPTLIAGLPPSGAISGALYLVEGLIGRISMAQRLAHPNDALIALLDALIAEGGREVEVVGPLLGSIAADRGEDVALALRQAGAVEIRETTTLKRLADAFGWTVSPLADQRLRSARAARLAEGLRAVDSRQMRPEPARLVDPQAALAVLVALRDRHVALRDNQNPDPEALRDALRRLAR